MPTDTDEKPETLNPADADWSRKTALKLRKLESTGSSDDPLVNQSKEVLGDPGSDPEARRQAVDNLDSGGDSGSFYRKSPKDRQGAGSLLAKLGAGSKRYGASGGILGLILGLFGLGSVMLGPASLLTNFSTIVNNHTDLGNHLFEKSSKSFVAAMFKNGGRDCAASKIKCKFSTISEKRLKEWESRGIKVTAVKSAIPGVAGDRYKVRGLEFPDGTKVTSLKQYNALRYNNPVAYGLLKRFPIRATYLNKKSSVTKSLAKFNRSIADKFKSNTKKDKEERLKENNASMDSKTGAITGEDGRVTPKGIQDKGKKTEGATKAAEGRLSSLKSGAALAGGVAAPVVAGCMTYDVIRATQAAMILYWHEELIKFALPFIMAGSQAKEAGVNSDFDWQTAEYYGDRLTAPITQKDIDEDPEDYITQDMLGKTAMDSRGFAAALNGDPVLNQNYSGWAPIKDVFGIGIVKQVQGLVGKGNIRNICAGASYVLYASMATCLAGPVAVAKCIGGIAAQQIVTNIWGDDIVRLISEQLSKPALEAIAKANLSSSLVGPALGDAIVSGAGVMANYADRASGFAVAGSADSAYRAYNDMVNDKEFIHGKIAAAQQEAAKDQLNPKNRHSFAGLFASKVMQKPWDGTLYSVLANIQNAVAVIPGFPFSATTYAYQQGVFQPVQVYNSQGQFDAALNNCRSPGMNETEIPCLGESGRSIPTILSPIKACMEQESLTDQGTICIEEAIDYLSRRKYKDENDKEQSFIDPVTGKPNGSYDKSGDDFKNPFLMYMRHCGNDRVYPLGYTDKPIDSENLEWYEGKKCASSGNAEADADLAWMSYYYNECIALYASEEDSDYCWDDSTSSLVANVSNGPWVCPVDTAKNGVQTQKPHDIGNGTASGVDYSYSGYSGPANAPIFAVRDGVVKTVGPASGYGYWVIIEHEENGKKVSSYYGHLIPGDILVKTGQTVKAGEHIANISAGKVGSSTGPHLHIGLKFDSGQPTAQDYETRFMAKC